MQLKIISNKYRSYTTDSEYTLLSCMMAIPFYISGIEKDRPTVYHNICYKNALRLNRCDFQTVHAIEFIFSRLYTTPFPYVKWCYGDCTSSVPDSPWKSKKPHLQVGASKSLYIRYVHRGGQSLLMCPFL